MRTATLLTAVLMGLCACQKQPEPLPRNIIVLLGDGMGSAQIGLLQAYARFSTSHTYPDHKSAIDRLLNQGQMRLANTWPKGALVTDSAASASQLSTGKPALSETIGLDEYGEPAETVVEKARRLGKRTGLITDTRLTHATPAAFAAHQRHRNRESEIAADLLHSGVDLLLGGGLRFFVPRSVNQHGSRYLQLQKMVQHRYPVTSTRDDQRDLLKAFAAKGYRLAFGARQLQKVKSLPLLGLFGDRSLPDAIAQHRGQSPGIPTLADMTQKALDLLSQDPNGFFLLVEGGQIDWAGHNNDAGTLLHELLRFDAAVNVVYQWVRQRNDTLVVLTADHATGAFGFSYSRYHIPAPRPISGSAFAHAKFAPNFNFVSPSVVDHLFAQKQSYYRLLTDFDALPPGKRTARELQQRIASTTGYLIDITDTASILATEHNEYQIPGHTYLDLASFPRIRDFKEFYVYGDESRADLIARALAAREGIVWGTGTHTHEPVPVVLFGQPQWTKQVRQLDHQTATGRFLNRMVGK